MKLKKLPFAAILPAKDLERSKKFYTEKLGLPEPKEMAPGHLQFTLGKSRALIIYQRDAGTEAKHTVAGWMTEDIESTIKKLRDKGVEFEQYDMPNLKTDELGIAEIGQIRTAWFKDPAGNILAINEASL